MTHVFIVTEKTFSVHLKYMFAGTGNAIPDINFLTGNVATVATSYQQKASISMLNDLERIRIGDKIVFFVTGISKFFGFFRVTREVFVEPVSNNYLKNLLGKTLTYRILMEPDTVYSEGITEYEALDSLQNVRIPQEMCWSLIYRKLVGNRGCTPITDFEANRLENLIINKNNNQALTGINFDFLNGSIINNNSHYRYNLTTAVDPHPLAFQNLNNLFSTHLAFEAYVQLLTLNTLKNNPNNILRIQLPIDMIGNEVSCGVGMQSIDVITLQKDINNNTIIISLIELKDEHVKNTIVLQLQRYLMWLLDYIIPLYNNYAIQIDPIIIGMPYVRLQKQQNLLTYLTNYTFNLNVPNNVIINTIKFKGLRQVNNSIII